MIHEPQLLDSITDASNDSRAQVVVSGSHGGLLPAEYSARFGVRGVMLNDAGIGLNNAGVAGVHQLASIGLAAAAVSHQSCHIGSASSALETGVISTVNTVAAELGVQIGQLASDGVQLLANAQPVNDTLAPIEEARRFVQHNCAQILLVDSASLVQPEDVGQIVITGSHGGLIGGNPARAVKADVKFAAFNDAGFGRDNIGRSRLPALQQRGIAAVTYSHNSAEIGNAGSAWESGTVSALNALARAWGAQIGIALKELSFH